MKQFYTVRDIEDMHAAGVVEIETHDDVVLTDVAREKAIALGMHLKPVATTDDARQGPGLPRMAAAAGKPNPPDWLPELAVAEKSPSPPQDTDEYVSYVRSSLEEGLREAKFECAARAQRPFDAKITAQNPGSLSTACALQ